ncbi:PROTEIN DISULFIDE ISOMERASE 4, ARABIDOPSIS THALIANA PROTEIN DISULFIDE ISOMERASE 4, PDI-like 1-6 [Hibiscus trionum]|uniref:protein disulfide-isomerase n=1 Tax=Hibiscus trionum TaxID=183268 RepID=A0A9W7HR64_HIBTR|nr:PROTEIN DISULFIDE ISOMERASE 4, ARABIDOPSIS THALIANA PROTEIN DISULFIDE ISOMERASE 4, PDI-like 1-6 [Hibiscus trionum]
MLLSKKPTSKFLLLTLTFVLLLSFPININASDPSSSEDDSDDLEQLLALDEQEDQLQQDHYQESISRFSEAEVLSKAQRIVLELNTDNSKRTIDDNEFVMLLGYAPWCVRSAELMPHFAEAATSLKELGSPIVMAKLDAERYPKVASLLDIKGFPTLLLFVNGIPQAYTGGFSAEEIVIWARKKTGVPVIRITTVTEAEDFLRKYHMFVIGLFEKFEGSDYEAFVKAAMTDNEIQFAETNNIEVAKVLYPDIKAINFLGIVKSEPERYTPYEGTFEMKNILQFLDYNKFPLVTKLTELNSVRVYSSPVKLQVYVFAKADDFKTLLEPLQEVARKFMTKIMFIYIDIIDENLAKPFLTLFGLEESKNTLVTAFDNKGSSKYLLQSDPTPSNIEEFCLGLQDGSISTYFKSQPIPDNNNASVLAVVGKTFDDLVLNSPKNVLLEVYTPWCINCETTSKQVEKLAKHFKGLDNLVFAKIDASANEHPKLQVDDYPSLFLYKASDKDNPIKLSPKSGSKELAAFINKQVRPKDQAAKDEL